MYIEVKCLYFECEDQAEKLFVVYLYPSIPIGVIVLKRLSKGLKYHKSFDSYSDVDETLMKGSGQENAYNG